jgi:hypothetical protein
VKTPVCGFHMVGETAPRQSGPPVPEEHAAIVQKDHVDRDDGVAGDGVIRCVDDRTEHAAIDDLHRDAAGRGVAERVGHRRGDLVTIVGHLGTVPGHLVGAGGDRTPHVERRRR